jgi:hypothetical protein
VKILRKRKCHKCSESFKDYKIIKDKAICLSCYDEYLELKILCSECKGKIKRKDEFIPPDKKRWKKVYCSIDCYNKMLTEEQDLQNLDDWLKNYHKVEKLDTRIYMQIKDFQRKYNFTIKGIHLTLEFITLVEGTELQLGNISLVPYYYDRAKKYYIEKQTRINNIKKLEQSSTKLLKETKSVVFTAPNTNRIKNILITEIEFSKEGDF